MRLSHDGILDTDGKPGASGVRFNGGELKGQE